MNPVTKPANTDLVVYELTDEDRKFKSRVKVMKGMGDSEENVIFHQMCIMQLVSAMTTQAAERDTLIKKAKDLAKKLASLFTADKDYNKLREELSETIQKLEFSDEPICVSVAITQAMIHLNDTIQDNKQRNQLKRVVEDIINTCPVRRTERQLKTKVTVTEDRKETTGYLDAERQRKELLKPVMDWRTYYPEPSGLTFNECLRLIRQAAAIFKVTPREMPGGKNNPIEEVH